MGRGEVPGGEAKVYDDQSGETLGVQTQQRAQETVGADPGVRLADRDCEKRSDRLDTGRTSRGGGRAPTAVGGGGAAKERNRMHRAAPTGTNRAADGGGRRAVEHHMHDQGRAVQGAATPETNGG